MRIVAKASLIFVAFVFSISTWSQEQADADALTLAISLSRPVHFIDSQGGDVLVPAGNYWVFSDESNLMLSGVETFETYTLAATTEKSVEEVSESAVISLPGSESEPDSHFIIYTSAAGEQLVAQGTYSGIRARGWRSDLKAAALERARQSAIVQAAKRKALENERLMQAAAAAAAVIERARFFSQDQALKRAEFLLSDIANTARQLGAQPALEKAKYYAPELAVLTAIIIPPGDRHELRKQTAIQISNNMGFIKEVGLRMSKSETIRKHLNDKKGLSFTNTEMEQIRAEIMGDASNPLTLPFVKPRSGYVSGPSGGIGANASAGAVIGVGVGTMLAANLTRGIEFDPVLCALFWGQAGVGPQLFAGIGVDFGAFTTAADEMLGWSIPVMATGGALGDFSVTAFFAPNKRANISTPSILTNVLSVPVEHFTGLVISPGAGAGAGVSINLSYTVTTGCFTRDGVTESPLE